jgi:hypothetical protein
MMFDDPTRDARHNEKFHRFVVTAFTLLGILALIAIACAHANYVACGHTACPVGWDIAL